MTTPKMLIRPCLRQRKYTRVQMCDVKGALTVEAALILPVLLCAFLSVVFIIRTVCTFELIQHALDETASEIAASSYIYHISGVRDLHDTVRNSVHDRSETFKEQMGSVVDAFSFLKGADQSGEKEGGILGIINGAQAAGDAKKDFLEVFDQSKNIVSDPMEELKIIACYIAQGSFNDAKNQLYIPVVKLYMKKYLISEGIPDIDERLRILGVVDGFDGLDFDNSAFLSDRDENIDIVVRYKVRMLLPVLFHRDMEFVQRAKVKAWMGGDEKTGVLDGSAASEKEDIWSLGNFQRGLKIRRIFGANLPNSFPVIAKYENGKAVMIKSMDLTASSYQVSQNTEKTLKGYINDFAKYKGQDKPWGSDNIMIREEDIREKELLLVIPENEAGAANETALNNMKDYARSKGINLVVKKYGMKKIEEPEQDKGSDDTTANKKDEG